MPNLDTFQKARELDQRVTIDAFHGSPIGSSNALAAESSGHAGLQRARGIFTAELDDGAWATITREEARALLRAGAVFVGADIEAP